MQVEKSKVEGHACGKAEGDATHVPVKRRRLRNAGEVAEEAEKPSVSEEAVEERRDASRKKIELPEVKGHTFPDVASEGYATRREQLKKKKDTKETNKRKKGKGDQKENLGREDCEEEGDGSELDDAKAEAESKSRRTAAKSMIRRTMNHISEEVSAEEVSEGKASKEKPKAKAKAKGKAAAKAKSRAAGSGKDKKGQKAAEAEEPEEADAEEGHDSQSTVDWKEAKSTEAKTRKAKASPKNRSAPKKKAPPKKKVRPPVKKRPAAASCRTSRVEPLEEEEVQASAGNLAPPVPAFEVAHAGLLEEAREALLGCLRRCWKSGELGMKGKHSHSLDQIDDKVSEALQKSVYWSRNAAGLKDSSNRQVCYFSKSTPCACTNIILANLWVFALTIEQRVSFSVLVASWSLCHNLVRVHHGLLLAKARQYLELPEPRDPEDRALAQVKLVLGNAHASALTIFEREKAELESA